MIGLTGEVKQLGDEVPRRCAILRFSGSDPEVIKRARLLADLRQVTICYGFYLEEPLLQALASLPRLRCLRIEAVDDDVVSFLTPRLSELENFPKLERVELGGGFTNRAKDEAFLRGIAALPTVRELELEAGSYNRFAELIAEGLEGLTIWSATGLSRLDFLDADRPLRSLGLKKCYDLDPTRVIKLEQLQSLDHLGLDRLEDLKPIARLTQLSSLDLSKNFDYASPEDYGVLETLQQLEEINLDDCGAAGHLGWLSTLPKLRRFSMLGSVCESIGDEDLEVLAGLPPLEYIAVELLGDGTTPEGIQALLAAQPEATAQFSYSASTEEGATKETLRNFAEHAVTHSRVIEPHEAEEDGAVDVVECGCCGEQTLRVYLTEERGTLYFECSSCDNAFSGDA